MYKILLAEDELLGGQILYRTIRESNLPLLVVGQAGSGGVCLKMARELLPDLVVMDYGLPDQDGLTVAAEIKRLLPGTEVIIVSEVAGPAIYRQAIRTGVADFLLKPFRPSELIEAVSGALDRMNPLLKGWRGADNIIWQAQNLSDYLQAVKKQEREKVRRAVDKILQNFCQAASNPSSGQLKGLAYDLLIIGAHALLDVGVDNGTLENEVRQQIKLVGSIGSVEDWQSWASEMVDMLCTCGAEKNPATEHLALRRALKYIEQHYTEDINLNDLARHVHLSPAYLSRIFKTKMNTNFMAILSELRIQRARELLVSSDLTIDDIAYEVGFKNSGYFARVFKKMSGMTPSAYRNRRGG